MLNVKCPGCGAVYALSEDLYARKAAGFGVVVTCRRCKSEIHVEASDSSAGSPGDAVPTEGTLGTLDQKSVPDAEKSSSATTGEAKTKSAAATLVGLTAAAPRAESPSPPRAAPDGASGRAQRPVTPGPKPFAKRDPISGPFVALSPGLLGGPLPEPAPDSEVPVDSSDFVEESKKGFPKPPPRRAAEPEKKAAPATAEKNPPPLRRAAEPALPLKIKEPPKPPKQKPRAPTRSDDVSEDLLSADVGFEGAPPLEAEAPRILAPDSSALAAPPPESVPAPKPKEQSATASASVAAPAKSEKQERSKSDAKPSRVLPIVLLSLGAAGVFALAFRSQLTRVPEPPADRGVPASTPPATPAEPTPEPAALAPTASEPTSPQAAASAAAPPTPVPGSSAPSAAPRADAPETTAAPAPAPAGSASASPKPAITAPAPGTPDAPDPSGGKPEGPFNAEAARTALAGAVAQASSCRKPGDPSGVAAVTITFSPSGRVTSATIAGPPFAGTPTGGCIAATLRRARVPAFTGDMVTVRKTVEIR